MILELFIGGGGIIFCVLIICSVFSVLGLIHPIWLPSWLSWVPWFGCLIYVVVMGLYILKALRDKTFWVGVGSFVWPVLLFYHYLSETIPLLNIDFRPTVRTGQDAKSLSTKVTSALNTGGDYQRE